MKAVPGFAALLGGIVALAACGPSASPSASVQASATEPAGQSADLPAVVCAVLPKPFDPADIDLTGAWAGGDEGIYYLRQIGSVVWWNGMSERGGSPMDLGREWNNVGRGVIDGLHIEVEWSDVPRGEILNNGTLTLAIQDDGTGDIQIVTEGEPGSFGNRVWTPCLPRELQLEDFIATYGGDPTEYVVIMTSRKCEDLAELENAAATTLNTSEAGSPEFRAALGYSNAIRERLIALAC